MPNAFRNTSSVTPWILGALGGAAVLALGLLAATDLGDPIGATRARLAREVEAETRLLQDGWEERLGAEAAPAQPLGTVLRWARGGLAPAGATGAGTAGETDTVGAALLQLAREHMAADRQTAAAAALERLAEQVPDGPLAWRGRLQAVRLARAFEDGAALERALAGLEGVPWGGAARSSLRLRGILAAAPALPEVECARLGRQVLDAFARGELVRVPGEDRVELGPAGLRLVLDPELLALQQLLEQRLPVEPGAWEQALDGVASGARALLDELEIESAELAPGRWRLAAGPAVPESMRLGLRADSTGLRAVLLEEREMLDAACGILATGRGWSVSDAQAVELPAEVFGDALVLEGISKPVRLVHADPGALVRAERRRLSFIRLALVVLAGLIGLVTWLGIRSLRNMARVAELRSHFVASVSHDLRTPLASISNLAENLEDGVVAGEHAVREYHGAIRREAARLGRIVNGLLDFASIERGQGLRVQRREVDVPAWVDELESSAMGHCRAHGVALIIERGGLPALATFDPDAVHRAVLNLIENAVRHSGESEVRLGLDAVDDVLGIRVSDRGKGLPAAVKADLFQPYVQGGESGGTGLGLALVRRIAEAHGGNARVASGADGKGLVASVEIRLEPGGAA